MDKKIIHPDTDDRTRGTSGLFYRTAPNVEGSPHPAKQQLEGEPPPTLRFGAIELDQLRFQLRRNGKAHSIQRRVFDTLCYLAQNRDRLVAKDELVAGPWEGAAVSDGALSRVIREARLAIGDDPTVPKMIVTIRGKGFRFLPEVVVVASREHASQAATTELERATAFDSTNAESKSRPTNGDIFAGRRVEFAELNSAYDDARNGHGKFVLVSGAPGIGKTALVEQFAEGVRAQGAEVLFGRCWEAQGTEPFWPWPELLENLAERRGRDWIETFADDVLEDLRPLLPYSWTSAEMVDRHEDLAAHRHSTFRVMRAATRFWHRVAESVRLVLVLEDLHLADAAALELLEFLCRSLDTSPLLLVGTCRTLDAQQRIQLRSAMEGALPHAHHVALRGLSNEDIVLWLRLIRGRASSAQFVNKVHGVTEGHPLLVKNLFYELPDAAGTKELDRMDFAAVQLPQRITTSIRRRLEQLEPRTFELLQAASVSGEELPLFNLAAALGRDLPEILVLIEDALQQGLVTRNAMGTYHFAHALIRATLYQELHPNIRSQMHAALGRAYLDLVGERPQEIVRAAHHLLAAESKDVAGEAVDVAVQAAEWARRHESYELAADLYARALEVFRPSEGTPRRRAELLGNLARVQLFAGRAEHALRSFAEMLEIGEQQGMDDLYAEAVLGEWLVKGELIVVDEPFQVRLNIAMNRARNHQELYAQLLTASVLVTLFSETEEARTARLNDALRISETIDNSAVRLSVLNAVMQNVAQPENVSHTLTLADEMLQLANKLRALDRLVDAGTWRASLLLELGRGLEYFAEITRCAERAKRLHPSFSYRVRILESGRAFMTGNLREAESLARSAFTTGLPTHGALASATFALQLQRIALQMDEAGRLSLLEEVLAILAQIAPLTQGYFPARLMLARARFELGAPGDYQALLRLFLESQTFPLGLPAGLRMAVLADFAECACEMKDAHAVEALTARLQPGLGLHISFGGFAYGGPVSYLLGLLAATNSSMAKARTMFALAIQEADSLGAKPYRAWAEYRLARSLEVHNGEKDADDRRRALLNSALSVARQHELSRLERMIANDQNTHKQNV